MKKVLTKLLIFTVLVILTAIAIYSSLLIYVNKKAEVDNKVKSDVILVLGGSAIGGIKCYGPICKKGFVPKPRLNPCLVARVDHAVSLYKKGYAPKILMTGGTDKETDVNEAETMKKIAISNGVPEKDILMEKESSSTYENFLLSKKVIDQKKMNSVIIVSDPYHNARASLVASKLKYKYTLSPTVESPCWEQNKSRPFTNRDTRREVFALIVYKLLNRI